MTQFHEYLSPFLDYGTTNETILQEVKSSWENDQRSTLQDVFREKLRSEIAKNDCNKSMNALLRIGDLRKKGAYKGLTRGMSFEEINACVNVELASIATDTGVKVPNSNMSLNEMQEWLDKEIVTSCALTAQKIDSISTSEKVRDQQNKNEELSNDKNRNLQEKSERENGITLGLCTPLVNTLKEEKALVDDRSLHLLEKYFKPLVPTSEPSMPSQAKGPDPKGQQQGPSMKHEERVHKTTEVTSPRDLTSSSEKEDGGGGGGGDGVRAVSVRFPDEQQRAPPVTSEPETVWLKNAHHFPSRRCEACAATNIYSSSDENYLSRPTVKRAPVEREFHQIEHMPEELFADITFMRPYYARILEKYITNKDGTTTDDSTMKNLAKTLQKTPVLAEPAPKSAKRSVHSVSESSRNGRSDRGENVTNRIKPTNRSKSTRPPSKLSRNMNENLVPDSLLPMAIASNKKVPCNSRVTSKTVISSPKLFQNNVGTNQSSQDVAQITKKETATTAVVKKTPKDLDQMPQSSTTGCNVVKNKSSPQKAKAPTPEEQPKNEGQGGRDGARKWGEGVGDGVGEGDRGGGGGGGGVGDGQQGMMPSQQLSSMELVRQWLIDSPQQTNDRKARKRTKKRERDYAAFTNAEKSEELHKIYGRSMMAPRPQVEPMRPHSIPATRPRRRPKWRT